jgi:hypothetical protein
MRDERTIVVLEGDETGQELLEESLRVLEPDVIGVELEFPRFDLSLERRRETDNGIVHEAAAAIRERGLGRKAGELGHLAHEGDGRHVADEGIVLRHVADARPRVAHAVAAIDAENARAAGAGAEEPEQRQDQCGLARAVGAQQAHGLARAGRAEAAGDPVKDLPPPQLDRQVFEFDDRYSLHGVSGALVRRAIAAAVRRRMRSEQCPSASIAFR